MEASSRYRSAGDASQAASPGLAPLLEAQIPRNAQRDFSKRAEKRKAILNGEQVILCHTERVNHP
jgi:hypothetical protein